MIDRLSGFTRASRVGKAAGRRKIILVFLVFTTFCAILQTIGARSFRQPERISGNLHRRSHSQNRAEPLRAVREAVDIRSSVTESGSESPEPKSTSPPPPESSPVKTSSPNEDEPYRLGPRITDWDEQRAAWLRNNPGRPSFVAPGKPRLLLVTGSAPQPCENPQGDHFLLKSMKNKVDYCRIHGCEVYYNMVTMDAKMGGFWSKLPLLRELMVAHPEVEFIWWMDSDALITDMAFEIPWDRYKDHNIVLPGWSYQVYDEKNWIGLNTGSFFIRNCQWSLDILDAWAPMGPVGKVRDEAGKFLSRELKDRPSFEADDQSALIYLLASQRNKWVGKVYLETSYCLHGYWNFLVDRYEEMIKKYRPGYGDDRWPFVTHFVGCKPCAKSGHYPVERCAEQMERAFDFADNQVLKIYGFVHKSLGSTKVERISHKDAVTKQ